MIKYFVLDGVIGPVVINNMQEFRSYFPDEIKEEYFNDGCLLAIPYQGSSSIKNGNLYNVEITENEDINVKFSVNSVMQTMDLRRLTILIPYNKTTKKIVYSF